METASGSAVATENLTRSFGRRRAVDGISLGVGAGETLALFGPNGAGKTTLLRILAGLLKPTSGSATIGGVKLPGGAEVRRRVGVISHHTLLYEALTARENVEFAARLYRIPDFRGASERALDRMRILDRADSPVRSLSRGMRQRVSVARAMVHEPRLILADEPFTGLDVVGASVLSQLLADVTQSGAAVILVTHNIDEGLALATRVGIMDGGRIVLLDDRASIDRSAFAQRYRNLVAAGA